MAPIRVLIVNDIQETRRAIKELLANERYIAVVGEASNGVEAVDEFEKLIPDVVCMNFNMPYLDGLTASQVISCRWEGARIFMLSNFCSVEDFPLPLN
jgi:chemotaxis response regulator CheB